MGEISLATSAMLTAVAALSMGCSLLLHDRTAVSHVRMSGVCVLLCAVYGLLWAYERTGNPWFQALSCGTALMVPWLLYRGFASFVPAMGQPRFRLFRRGLTLCLLLLHLIAPLLHGSLPQATGIALVYLTLAYVMWSSLYTVTRIFRAAQTLKGTAIAPRLHALFAFSLLAAVFALPWLPVLTPISTALYLYGIGQLLVRQRFLEPQEMAGRLLSIVVFVSIIGGGYLLVIGLVGRGSISVTVVLSTLITSFAVAALMDPIRLRIDAGMESWLLRDQKALYEILLRLREQLANVIEPQAMADIIIGELAASNRVTRAGLFLLDQENKSYVLQSRLGILGLARLELPRRRSLIERATQRGVILRDNLVQERNRSGNESELEIQNILDTLELLGARLIVPIVSSAPSDASGNSLVLGLLAVDDERLLEPFVPRELEMFEQVAAQAAITLQNSTLYEQRKEQDRLATLGQMAAGLAHEIRNPLGSIKGAAQLVAHGMITNPEKTREFLHVIIEETDRLNQVVTQFLQYSRPFRGDMETLDIEDVFVSTQKLLPPHRAAHITISTKFANNQVPTISGNHDALRQVFHNLLLNALDAAEERGDNARVLVNISKATQIPSLGAALCVTIHDNGPGLSMQALSQLFTPFYTTKPGGTGLGLAMSHRIIEHHRGRLFAHNHPEGGAVFTTMLPLTR